jgi:hypothetical protein
LERRFILEDGRTPTTVTDECGSPPAPSSLVDRVLHHGISSDHSSIGQQHAQCPGASVMAWNRFHAVRVFTTANGLRQQITSAGRPARDQSNAHARSNLNFALQTASIPIE